MIQETRISTLSNHPVADGDYVLYWMQAAQRASCNHALEYAIAAANALRQPVVVCFGLTERYLEANLRHYAFMLEGLVDVAQQLRRRRIQLVVRQGEPAQVAIEMAGRASLVVADVGYFPFQKAWRQQVARGVPRRVVQVESEVVVPVEVVSDKEEWAARTIRPRIHRHLREYLVPLAETKPLRSSLDLHLPGLDISDPRAVLADLRLDRTVAPSAQFRGGTGEARRRFAEFLDQRLPRYHELRSEPGLNWVSHMSPYLHFGQISPLELALAASEQPGPGAEAFLEELVVRRELSMNFVHYNGAYHNFACLPDWAQRTLRQHQRDRRVRTYTLEELEAGATEDPYWNAAQMEMVLTGKMHNYMRMYWGKKVIEWTEDPQEAYQHLVYLNNKYELDGRDPNSYAGIAWCFGKHDRPWAERPIFGTVRYMSATGLERKFDMQAYLERIAALA